MSLSAWEQQALDSIKDGLAGSAPELAALLATFTELSSDEDMPVRENIQASSNCVFRRSRREGRRHGRDKVTQVYRFLRLRYALVLWLLVTAALIGVALALSQGGGPASCTAVWSASCGYPAPASSPAWPARAPEAALSSSSQPPSW